MSCAENFLHTAAIGVRPAFPRPRRSDEEPGTGLWVLGFQRPAQLRYLELDLLGRRCRLADWAGLGMQRKAAAARCIANGLRNNPFVFGLNVTRLFNYLKER